MLQSRWSEEFTARETSGIAATYHSPGDLPSIGPGVDRGGDLPGPKSEPRMLFFRNL
jgi:hypothetical protein